MASYTSLNVASVGSTRASGYTTSRFSAEVAQEFLAFNNMPERNLLGALVERTMMDLKLPPSHPEHKSAKRWIFRRCDESEPWSLEWIALHLELCPDAFRNAVQNYGRRVINGEIDDSEKSSQKYRKQYRKHRSKKIRECPKGSLLISSHRD